MNLSYKLVKNKQSGELVVASELAKGHKKNTRKTLAASMILLASLGHADIDLSNISYEADEFSGGKLNPTFKNFNNNSQQQLKNALDKNGQNLTEHDKKILKEHFLINDGSSQKVQFSNVNVKNKAQHDEGTFEKVTIDKLLSAGAVKLFKKDGTPITSLEMPQWKDLNFTITERVEYKNENGEISYFDAFVLPTEESLIKANPLTDKDILVKQPAVPFYEFNIVTANKGSIDLTDTANQLNLDFGQAKKTSLFTADTTKNQNNTDTATINVGDSSTSNAVNMTVKFDRGYVAGSEDSIVKDKVSFGPDKTYRGAINVADFAGQDKDLAASLALIAKAAGKGDNYTYNITSIESLKAYQEDLIKAVQDNLISSQNFEKLFSFAFKVGDQKDYYVEIDYDPTKNKDNDLYLDNVFSSEVGILSILKATGHNANIVINQNAVMNVTNGDVAYLDQKSALAVKGNASLTSNNGNIINANNQSTAIIEAGAKVTANNGLIVNANNQSTASNRADTVIGNHQGNVALNNQSSYTNETNTQLTYKDNFITDKVKGESTFKNKGIVSVETSDRDNGIARSATNISGNATYTNETGAKLYVGTNDIKNSSEIEHGGELVSGVSITGSGQFINNGDAFLGKKTNGQNSNITYTLPASPTENDLLLKNSNTIIGASSTKDSDVISISNTGTMTIGDKLTKSSDAHIQHAAGINFEYTGNTPNTNVQISNSGTITVGGYHTVGMRVSGLVGDDASGTGQTISNTGTINVIGANSIGIVANEGAIIYNNGTINIGGTSPQNIIDNKNLDSHMSRRNYGLKSEGGAKIYTAADSLKILTDYSVGAYARQGGEIIISGDASKAVSGSPRDNIVYYWISGKRLSNGKYVSSTIAFDNGHEVNLSSQDTNSTFFRIDQGAEFTGSENNTYKFGINGENSTGMYIADAGTIVNVSDKMTFDITGNNTTGIYVASGAGSLDDKTNAQGKVTLNAGAKISISGDNSSAAVVDGAQYDLNKKPTNTNIGATLDSYAYFTDTPAGNSQNKISGKNAVAYKLINAGRLNHYGTINLKGDVTQKGTATGILLKGGILNNTQNAVVEVNGIGVDIYAKVYRNAQGELVERPLDSQQSIAEFEKNLKDNGGTIHTSASSTVENLGAITAVNGTAAVRVNDGVTLTIKGGTNSLVKGENSADAIRVHDGATLKAENAEIAVDGSGAGIHFMNTDSSKSSTFKLSGSGNIDVKGAGATGVLVQGENGTTATANFDSTGSKFIINVNDDGGNGIITNTSGYVKSGSSVNINSSTGESALIIKGTTKDVTQSGTLTSKSSKAVVDLAQRQGTEKITFTNTGKIISDAINGIAVQTNNQQAIDFINSGSGVIQGAIVLTAKDNNVTLYGGTKADVIQATHPDSVTTVTLKNVTASQSNALFNQLSANSQNDTIKLVTDKNSAFKNHYVLTDGAKIQNFELLDIGANSTFEVNQTTLALNETLVNASSGIKFTNTSSIFKINDNKAVELNHKLIGNGRVEVNLNNANNAFTFADQFTDFNSENFTGALALSNAKYTLIGNQSKTLTKATLEVGNNAFVTVLDGKNGTHTNQKIGGLKFTGGTVNFEDQLSNLVLTNTASKENHADTLVIVDNLHLTNAKGTVSLKVDDNMYHGQKGDTANVNNTVFKPVLEHDQGDSLIKVVDSKNVIGTVPSGLHVQITGGQHTDETGTALPTKGSTVRVVQGLLANGTEVAKGHYDYGLKEQKDGLYVSYQLEKLQLLQDASNNAIDFVLSAKSGETLHKNKELDTQIIGNGNLIINTASDYVALKNDRANVSNYTGKTLVQKGDLFLESNNVLGQTSLLDVATGSTVHVAGKVNNTTGTSQSVGALNVEGTVDLHTNGQLTTKTMTITTDGLMDLGISGILTINGQNSATSIVNGELKGNPTSNLIFNNANATVNSANSNLNGNVTLTGTSVVDANNAKALGGSGIITIEKNGSTEAKLRLTNTDKTVAFTKKLAGAGQFVVTDGSTVSITNDNSSFTGRFTIGEGKNTNPTLVNITNESALGLNNIVHINAAEDTLALTTNMTTEFKHKLSGSGVLKVDLAGKTLTMGEHANPMNNALFDGTLSLHNTLYTLDSGANTKSIHGATLDANQSSIVTVAKDKGIQTIGGLEINNGGTINFQKQLSNSTGNVLNGSIATQNLATNNGTIAVNLDDMNNTVVNGSVAIISQDNNQSIQLIDAAQYNAVANDLKLGINYSGVNSNLHVSQSELQNKSQTITQSILQNGNEVAQGQYEYNLKLLQNAGISIAYTLKEIQLLAKDNAAFILQAAKNANDFDLSAKVTGTGDLRVNTESDYVSLSNSNNDYTGKTIVEKGDLYLEANNALGKTSSLDVGKGTAVNVAGKVNNTTGTSQTVGALNVEGTVNLHTNGKLTTKTMTVATDGLVDLGVSGTLTVNGQNSTASVVDGELKGNSTSNLTFNNANATVNSTNTGLTGSVNLTGTSVVNANNSHALGTNGTVNIANTAELQVANSDSSMDFTKTLNGDGQFSVITGTDAQNNAVDSIVNLVGNNLGFNGQINIGTASDTAKTVLAITDETSLGANTATNVVNIAEKGTLAFTTNTDATFNHQLKGNGTFATDLAGKVLNMGASNSQYTGTNFNGTLALTNTQYTLDNGANTTAMTNATIDVKTGSTLTVKNGTGIQNIGGLQLNDGKVIFEKAADGKDLNDRVLSDHIKVNKELNLSKDSGTVVVNIADMQNLKGAIAGPNSKPLLTHDDGNPILKVIDADTANLLLSGKIQLELYHNNTLQNTDAIISITENNIEVAKGTYGYGLSMEEDGLHVAYKLTEVEILNNKSFTLTAAKNATGSALDLGAKVTGTGNLVVNTNSNYVSLSNNANNFTGSTTVAQGTLSLENDNVLGQTNSHTSVLNVGAGTTVNTFGERFNKDGTSQIVGALNSASTGTVNLGSKGELTISGKSNSLINGTLTGGIDSQLTFDNANATINSTNTNLNGSVDLTGTSTVTATNSQALGKTGAINIADTAELKVSNSDAKINFTKELEGKGQFSVITGTDAQGNATNSIVNVIGDNSGFTGQINIGTTADQANTELAITDGNSLGSNNTVNIAQKGTLSLTTNIDTEFDHQLKGNGTFATDLSGKALNISQSTSEFTGKNFTGNLSLTNTQLTLGKDSNTLKDANTEALTNATVIANNNSVVNVAAASNVRNIGGLTVNGGTVNFEHKLSNSTGNVANGSVATQKLATNNGTININLDDMTNTIADGIVSIISQDNAQSIKLIDAAQYDAIANNLKLGIKYEGVNSDLHLTQVELQGKSQTIAQSILQGSDGEVAQGQYEYSLKLLKDAGVSIVYTLKEIKLLAKDNASFILHAAKNATDVDLAAKVTGTGDLRINTESSHVSLSNSNNTYTGKTIVEQGDLYLEADNALGQTSSLNVASGTTVNVAGKANNTAGTSQTVGALNVDGTVNLADKGHLTVTGKSDSLVNGSLVGGQDSQLTFNNADALINSVNTKLKGSVNLAGSSTVILNNAHAIGTVGTANIAKNSQLQVTNSDAGLTFTKKLNGNGQFSVVTGTDHKGNSTDTILNLVGNNSGFSGQVNIGQSGDTAATTLAITDEKSLGVNNAVNITKNGLLSLTGQADTHFEHKLMGTGIFETNLAGNTLNMSQNSSQFNGQNFKGTLSLIDTKFKLDGSSNTQAVSKATVKVGQDALLTVVNGLGDQNIGGIQFAGGTVEYLNPLSNLELSQPVGDRANSLIKVDTLDTRNAQGTISIVLDDMQSLPQGKINVFDPVIEHDRGESIIHIMEANDYEGISAGALELVIKFITDGKSDINDQINNVYEGNENTVTHVTADVIQNIQQNDLNVAKGHYGYGLELIKQDEITATEKGGLHVSYKLKTLEILEGKDFTLVNHAGKTGSAVDFSAKVTGSGNLVVNTESDYISLSNSDNDYTGTTTVIKGDFYLESDNVLGNTSNLIIKNGTDVFAHSKDGKNSTSQTIGALNVDENSALHLGNQGGVTIKGDSDSVISGTLTGKKGSELIFNDGNATIHNANSGLNSDVKLNNTANVQLYDSAALGNQGSVQIDSSAELKIGNSNEKTPIFGKELSGNGQLTITTGLKDGKVTDSTVALSGDNSDFTGNITIGHQADDQTTKLIANEKSLGGDKILISHKGTLELNHNDKNDWTVDKSISGKGNVVKSGSGTVELSQNSSNYTGKTTIKGGQLVAGNGDKDYVLHSKEVEVQANASFVGTGGSLKGHVNNYGEFVVGNSVKKETDGAISYTVEGNFTNHNNGVIRLNNTYPDGDNTDKNNTNPVKHGNIGNQLNIKGNYYANGGSIILNTALNEGFEKTLTDSIHVTGNVIKQGAATKVFVQNYGGNGAFTQLDAIKIISVDGKSDGGAFTLGGPATIGIYEYTLHKGQNDNNWYLYSNPDYPIYAQSGRKNINPLIGGYLANMSAAFGMFNMTLHDRLGNPSYGQSFLNPGDRGISTWGRIVTTHQKYRAAGEGLAVSGDLYMAQVGADLIKVAAEDDGSYRFGLMAAYGNSDFSSTSRTTGTEAKGKIDQALSIGVYGTWYQPEGWFVDAWLQYSHFKNEVSLQQKSSSKYNSNLLNASIEIGYNHKMDEFDNGDYLIIQPNAQVVFGRLSSKGYSDFSSGIHVNSNKHNNVQIRLGAKLFYVPKSEDNKGFRPYVEANWIHSTSAVSATFNDKYKFSTNAPSNIYEVKVGVEGDLSKDWSVWGNVGFQKGKSNYKGYKATLGVKYTW